MSGGTADAARRETGRSEKARRRIEAARGYLVLDMAEHALAELAGVPDPTRHRFEVCRLRGDALRQLGRFAEAAAAYTRAWAERADCLPVLMGLADCYRRAGQIDRAVTAMEDANRLHPNEPAVLFALARFYAVTGQTERSLGWLGRAVRLCPDVADWADGDDDFAPLRESPHFRFLVEAAAERRA